MLLEYSSNAVAASVECSRATCSASMQHVSEQKENKVSWLDQLSSWWDKNSTAITTGVIAIAIGTVAVMTVVATGGLAAPALAAAFAGALGTTYGALAAGVTAATTGVVSLASTVPGLSQALSPTVNSTSFQMLQSGSMIIAGTGAAFLAQFAPTSNNKTQTQKEETQGVGNPVDVAGRGSTGRTDPNTLNEQMAMEQVQSDPLKGATKVPIEMADTRWPKAEGWVKMESIVKTADNVAIKIHKVKIMEIYTGRHLGLPAFHG